MKLYIFRHGDALSEGERPLSERGREETTISANGMKRLGVKPTVILHSPLVRAEQTAEILTSVFSLPEQNVIVSDLRATKGDRILLLHEIKERTESNNDEIILVGHLPDLGELITYLVWGEPIKEIPIKKSGVAMIEFDTAHIGSGRGVLRWFLTHDALALIAKAEE